MKIAILSDLHANKFAVKAVFDELDKEHVAHILIAGDLIGYYYWPSEIVQLCMQDDRVQCVQGNHELNLKSASESDLKLSELTKKYGSSYKKCLTTLSPKELEWLFSLPKELIVKFDNISFFVTHGSLTSANEYLYPNSPIQQLLSNYSNQNFTIFGHTHHSFVHAHGNKYLLNPGSVGQPRDVGNLASYAIVDTSTQSLRFKKISFHVDQIISEATANDPSIPYLKKVLKRGCL
tara:strand:+ start:638 stop:1342 length:705 start_codon:yes stop_codon:yes gene_type:complete